MPCKPKAEAPFYDTLVGRVERKQYEEVKPHFLLLAWIAKFSVCQNSGFEGPQFLWKRTPSEKSKTIVYYNIELPRGHCDHLKPIAVMNQAYLTNVIFWSNCEAEGAFFEANPGLSDRFTVLCGIRTQIAESRV